MKTNTLDKKNKISKKNSKKREKIAISSGIDWLSCTLDITKFDPLRAVLLDFNLLENGTPERLNPLHGYLNAIKLLGGRFQWGFAKDKAFCHFELSGQGCLNLGGEIWRLLDVLKNFDAKFTRIDLAFDFENTMGVMRDIRTDLKNGCFSGFKSWQEITTNTLGVNATTFYLGSRSSTRFARIYDKGLESGITKDAEKIIRFEYIFRGEQSSVVAQILIKEVSSVLDVAGLTFNLYKFGFFKRGANKNSWVNSEWYQILLDSFDSLILREMPSFPRNYDFEKFCQWLSVQVSPQIKALAFQNRITAGEVLDTILSFYNVPFSIDNVKHTYNQPFKKMLRNMESINNGN